MPQANDAMQTLTAQWYNAMVTGLSLSDQSFQLYQGPSSVVATSMDLWNLFNAVPPNAINNFLDPTQANTFAADYNLILSALVTASDTDFQRCMGDYYGKWQTYFAANVPDDINANSVSKVFNKWAVVNAPAKASCVTALSKVYINPINTANNMFASANGTFAWNRTIDDLQSSLAGGQSKSFTMNSASQNSDLKHTWANGAFSASYNLFSVGGSGSYDDLSTLATSSGLNITAEFEKVTTFTAGPYSQADPNNQILADYQPWYYGAALSQAYSTKDNTVWNNQKPTTWNTAFGPGGFFQRMITALVIADGITIKISSSARYNSSQQQQITASAKAGVWPFFSASTDGGTNTEVSFSDAGEFTITTTNPKGNPQCLGILQSPMSQVFG